MGVWGLLIGVTIFIFLLNALEVDYSGFSKREKHKHKHKKKKEGQRGIPGTTTVSANYIFSSQLRRLLL